MCGIWALFGKPIENPEQYVNKLRNRGPEETKIVTGSNYQLGFTRLAINGLTGGSQPFEKDGLVWMPKWSPETNDPSARTLNPSTMNTS